MSDLLINQKIKLLENIQNSSNFTYEQSLELIGYIDPDIKFNIQKDIDNLDLDILHGKILQETIDNIICNNIDKWISRNESG